MKKLAALLCLLSTTSIAATGTATATVKIVPGLTITQTQELDFGSLTCTGEWVNGFCGRFGMVDSDPSYEGNVTQLGNPTLPSFKVTGEYNAPISFGFHTGTSYSIDFNLTKSGGQYLGVFLDIGAGGRKGILSTNEGNGLGAYTINNLNAYLYIPTNPDPGTYTGSYNIVVNYQ